MPNIDERLLAAQAADRQRQEEMFYSDRLRQDKMASADRERQERSTQEKTGESGSFRQRIMAARRAMDLENLKKQAKEKIKEKVTAPAREGTNWLLKAAWLNLIDSFGLTLIWINIHVFLRFVLGDKLFCKLGHEWIPKQVTAVAGEAGEMGGKTIGIFEVMALLLLDFIALLIILAIVAIIVIIVTFMTDPVGALKAIWELGWEGVRAFYQLFRG